MRRRFVAARSSPPEIKTFFAIDAAHAFVIVLEAFASEQNVNACHSIANTHGSDLFDTGSNSSIVSTMRFVISQRASQETKRAGSAQRDVVFIDKLFDQMALLFGSQSFF